jgi:hypothetical protein
MAGSNPSSFVKSGFVILFLPLTRAGKKKARQCCGGRPFD